MSYDDAFGAYIRRRAADRAKTKLLDPNDFAWTLNFTSQCTFDQFLVMNRIELVEAPAAERPRCYISGPISGHDDGNRSAFRAMHSRLRNEGFEVTNPHVLGDEVPKMLGWADMNGRQRWRAYMDVCVKAIPDCSHMVMLRGWWWSSGARVEWLLAKGLGLTVRYDGGWWSGGDGLVDRTGRVIEFTLMFGALAAIAALAWFVAGPK